MKLERLHITVFVGIAALVWAGAIQTEAVIQAAFPA
jgi:hypothetical protein